MKVDIFTLCDFANAERGKMNIVGAFSSLNAKQAPVIVASCALAIRMRFERIEEGQKKIRISFIDADGKPVMPTLQADMAIKIPAAASSAIGQFVLVIQPLKLPSFGEYSIDLAIDGRQEASFPLFVKQIQTPPQQLIPPGSQPPTPPA